MTVSLTNLSKNAFTIVLYHQEYCQQGGPCTCSSKTGSSSLTLGPREKKSGLHPAILKVSQVDAAIHARPSRLRAEVSPDKPVTQDVVKSSTSKRKPENSGKAVIAKEENAPVSEDTIKVLDAQKPLGEQEPRSSKKRAKRKKSPPKARR